MKRIVICADGTWNRPEEELGEDFPTNVLKTARGVRPTDEDENDQVVFYDWGIGSYYDEKKGGAFGTGINKNIQDGYRFIVQNYDPSDELYFFGFSRGAYTVRSLSGLINNCGILKREHANLIESAFELYKSADFHPDSRAAKAYRRDHAVEPKTRVKFIGVWDTVGSLGIPRSVWGFLQREHLFHDLKIGPNVDIARHALAIDERRKDFEPTIWKQRTGLDLRQVWFAGVHSDVGGSYKPDRGGKTLADIPLAWMIQEAEDAGLICEGHLKDALRPDPHASQHEEFDGIQRLLGAHDRSIPRHTWLHESVRERWRRDRGYRPKKLKRWFDKYGWDRMTS